MAAEIRPMTPETLLELAALAEQYGQPNRAVQLRQAAALWSADRQALNWKDCHVAELEAELTALRGEK